MQAAQLLARARRVRLFQNGAADAPLAGVYRSAYRGAGMEYEESREYTPGDDVAAMDWKATARLGRPFVKRYREERSRTLMLAVDASPSMAFAAAGPSLYETAAVAAVTLAVSAAASRDRVGLVLFTDRVEAFVPPTAGPAMPYAVARTLAETIPAGRTTDPAPALALAATALAHRAVVFVLSDFLAGEFTVPLGRLAARHDVAAACLAANDQTSLPPAGLVTVTDLETGGAALLDCGNSAARSRYAAAREQSRRQTLAALAAVGAEVLTLPGNTPPAPALAAFFRRRAGGAPARRRIGRPL
ncbi:DUF58 domain-containing protein [Desulfovibrio sp. TomC]|uniref:DUF58 domain-containing protein n=1 Tax=Desulfovibrio sp. TomC TaxID=1562888 RepID=UPI000573DC4E|nr:DUF58 domain-containing protein [Desulfovibrio sp. TomC]KHK00857.1 hypothetical protein NY78_3745 [Desulfovibrio sp. TomC]